MTNKEISGDNKEDQRSKPLTSKRDMRIKLLHVQVRNMKRIIETSKVSNPIGNLKIIFSRNLVLEGDIFQ